MKGRHIGIFALAFLTLLFTIPSAFAQETGIPNAAGHANAAFNLMDLITNGQTEAATLNQMIANNGLNVSLDEYAEALDEAAGLVAAGEYENAEAVLADADEILDDVYTQLYAQVDSRQNERFTDFVENAIDSISFIVNYGDNLGISAGVIEELEITLAILEGGDYDEILAATSETSDTGLTALMFPDDHPGFGNASPNNNGQGKGLGLGDAKNLPPAFEKLPPGIKARYDISTDSNLSTESSDGTDGIDGTNGDGVTNVDEDFDFFSTLPGFGVASENGQTNGQGQGVGLGVGPEAPGIMKKDMDWLYDHGFIIDDSWEDSFEDDDFAKDKGQGKGKGPKDCKGKECGKSGADHGKGKGNDPPGQGNDPPGQGNDPPGQGNDPPGRGGGSQGQGG